MTTVAARPAPAGSPLAAPYEHLSAAERYIHVRRDQAALALLQQHGYGRLEGLRILELGCGEGSLLRTLLHHGATPGLLEGVDTDRSKAAAATASVPGASVAIADVAALPYRDGSFDLAFAFTLFSSVINDEARRRGAREALRVLRPGGLMLVYDFWVNPLNRSARPLREAELRALVHSRRLEVRRVTLAPPIVRALGGRPALCRPLEALPFLRTHLLACAVKEA